MGKAMSTGKISQTCAVSIFVTWYLNKVSTVIEVILYHDQLCIMFSSYVLFIPFFLPFSSATSLFVCFFLVQSTAQALLDSRESQIGCILWRYVSAALTRFLSEPCSLRRTFFCFCFVLLRFSYSSLCWCHLCTILCYSVCHSARQVWSCHFEYIKKGFFSLLIIKRTDPFCCHSYLRQTTTKNCT